METESKQCYRCKYPDRYYTKEVKRFCKTKFGRCREKRAEMNIHESCERFEQRASVRGRPKLLKNYLNDLLTEITEIRKVLEEEKDEREEM